ncbi:MAG: ATP-binding protein [Bacteroidales bacterium]|nr:ATP-binding protein [Bacteroidales bacterium]MDD3663780.1 ATP-binding protein [Bacteroidales bacterium]
MMRTKALSTFSKEQLGQWIADAEVFSGADAGVLDQLSGAARVLSLDARQVLFEKGDEAHSMFIVAQGVVSVHIDQYELSELKPGSLIGEYALVDDNPRSATVTAKVNTLLVEIPKREFLSILQNNTLFCFAVMKMMIRRSRRMNELEEKLASSFNEIQLRNAELLQLNTEKNALIDLVAHDLRNPLTSSRCAVEMLRDDPAGLSTDQADCVRLIDNALGRMRNIVNQILDVEVIESHQLRVNLQPIDFSLILKEVTDGLMGFAQQKGIAIVSVGKQVTGVSDRSFVTQIFDNLISNAIKYSPFGAAIVLILSANPGIIRFEVQDQGPGIDPAELPTLFSRYQRGKVNPTAGESSLGLGLSIVKKLVTVLHGEVLCESSPGKGSRFVVLFPA